MVRFGVSCRRPLRLVVLVFGTVLFGGHVIWPFFDLHLAIPARAGESVKLPREDLQKIVTAASVAQAYVFPGQGSLGPERTIATADAQAGPRLAGNVLQQLRTAIFSAESYQGPAGLENSCPFYPSVGFRFGNGAHEAWWLVSATATCRTAILVGPKDDWRKARTLNLTADAVRDFVLWAQSPRPGG